MPSRCDWIRPSIVRASLDDPIRAEPERPGNRETQRPGGFQVDHQLELGGLLYGQLARLGTFEDLDVISTLASCPARHRLAPQSGRQSSLRQEAEAMVHVGVDLDKRSSQIAVLTA